MQGKKRELENLIERYSTGKLTDTERAHLMQWMQELDVNKAEQVDMDLASNRMKEKIDARLLPAETEVESQQLSWQFFAKLAALVLFCFSFSWYLMEWDPVDRTQQRQFTKAAEIAVKSTRMTCSVSQDSLISLEDGSRVRLLAHSSLTWVQPFPKGQRAIQLEGKAFFEVAHDPSRPFTVLAGNILTTALGTSFWVTQETKNATPRVRLISGKVSIKERSENGSERLLAYLSPGQIWRAPTAQPKKEPVAKSEKPPERVLPTLLTFQHKPLKEVLPALASFYRTSILFSEEEVAELSLYGTYTQENDIAQILQTICIANDLRLEFNAEKNTYRIVKSRL